MTEPREFPPEFVKWFTEWANRAPIIDDDEDEDAYAAWYAGRESGIEYERYWHECPTNDE